MNRLFFTLITLPLALSVYAQADSTLIRKHIYYLASEELAGRAPGTDGEKKAAEYIKQYYEQYGLLPKGSNGYEQEFTYKQSSNPHDTLSGIERKGKNLIGYLDNGAENTIVIGGHYDHLGDDGRGSSLEKEAHGKIHYGADDNASGTAGVLELARYFSTNNVKEKTNFLFVCFSAEEAGLIGSKYFTNNPTVSLDNISAMLNMDMIGRLNDSTNKLLIYGTGTSDVWEEQLKKHNNNRFVLVLDSSGVGPSDQTSFYLKKIPVLHFFTGQHSDYHKSSDVPEKINYSGEVSVLNYIASIATAVSELPKLKYFETRTKDTGSKSAFKVTLGVMPDYGYQGKGLRVDAVNHDKPAEKAGLKDGDIVVQLGEIKIENIYDYMKALGAFNKGDKAVVKVDRDKQTLTYTVEF